MSELDKYVDLVRNGKTTKDITNDDRLEFYSLYKQFTVGNVNVARPSGMFDFEGKAKWDAWKKQEGVSKEIATERYINKAKELF